MVDPIGVVEAAPNAHPKIPVPKMLYGDRLNSMGVDVSVAAERALLGDALVRLDAETLSANPIVSGREAKGAAGDPVHSPTDHRTLGQTVEASAADIDAAFAAARAAQPSWDALGGHARAKILRGMGDALETNRDRLAAICVREAGKTWLDAIGEVREAADFCRYYALLAEKQFGEAEVLKGPAGEVNVLEMHGRGVFVCISPWNFPLAIFTGQIAAALAAGNAVLAKPAEQTPLIAAEAVRLYHRAGLDARLLHLLARTRRNGRSGLGRAPRP